MNGVEGVQIFQRVLQIFVNPILFIFLQFISSYSPQVEGCPETDIEYFFSNVDRLKQHKGKCFNTVADRDPSNDLSKEAFATHIVNHT